MLIPYFSLIERTIAFFTIAWQSGIEKSADLIECPLTGNASNLPIISLDVPSGVNADTGKAAENGAVKAHTTLTFGRPKKGLFTGEGALLRGGIRVLDIGLT